MRTLPWPRSHHRLLPRRQTLKALRSLTPTHHIWAIPRSSDQHGGLAGPPRRGDSSSSCRSSPRTSWPTQPKGGVTSSLLTEANHPGMYMTTDFEAFVKVVQQDMHNLALALTGGHVHEAKDLVQSSLERIWARWDRLKIEEPRAYARTVVAREFATVRRRVRWNLEWLRAEAPDLPVDDSTASSDEALILLSALSRLPCRQREVVVLRYLEDMSVAQVASILSCSEGSVKRSAHDGLRGLRTVLGQPTEGSDASCR